METEKNVIEAEASPPKIEDQPQHEEEHEPKGAFSFIVIMATFYVGYWIFTWIEIFVIRRAL